MDYALYILIIICLYSIITLTGNILLGYLGILYLAIPAIYGIGAYTFAILATNGSNTFLAIFLGGIFAMIGGLLLSIPALKLKSHYIGIATLAFLFIISSLTYNLKDLTRGSLGIPGIPRPTIFGLYLESNLSFFIFTLIVTIIICTILYKILHSPFAKVIEAIREDEIAVKTLGKNTKIYKLQAFMISTFFSGIAGALFASYLGFINPQNFHIPQLTTAISMIIVGGMASFWGSILGTVILVLVPEILRFLTLSPDILAGVRLGIYGLILILFMLFKPNGLMGKRTNIFSK
ncbi:branched-chain amino acid ABC transporter permease [Candidatus Peregrinibacteria bacterium]|nr:branched-chain amino acid ABC transporter permease [Candidatus Peregrinibacteria bacterium]